MPVSPTHTARISLTRRPTGVSSVVVLDIGFIAVARERGADTLARSPLHLLGESIDALLPANITPDKRLTTSHEFSIAF